MSDNKQQFIDDYVQAALESPNDHRNPDQIYSDAEAEWEGSQTDAAYESNRDREMSEP